MTLQFKRLNESAKLPTYGTTYADCFDFYLPDDWYCLLDPGEVVKVFTGLIAIIPDSKSLHIYARSGLSINHGIVLANGTGIIDQDYRNELIIALRNVGDSPVKLEGGNRIAQGRLWDSYQVDISEYFGEVELVGNRVGGLGSTGK